jgi:hypothetical protein
MDHLKQRLLKVYAHALLRDADELPGLAQMLSDSSARGLSTG